MNLSTMILMAAQEASEAATPWFSGFNFPAWYGAIAGGVGGGLLGTIGGMSVFLMRSSGGRRFLKGAFIFFAVFGIVNLITGLVAISVDQPWPICYAFLLVGFIMTTVTLSILPALNRMMAAAEERQVDAAGLR